MAKRRGKGSSRTAKLSGGHICIGVSKGHRGPATANKGTVARKLIKKHVLSK